MFETLDDVIKEARRLADMGQRASAIEDDPSHPDYPPDWQTVDDARAEFVYALASLEVID